MKRVGLANNRWTRKKNVTPKTRRKNVTASWIQEKNATTRTKSRARIPIPPVPDTKEVNRKHVSLTVAHHRVLDGEKRGSARDVIIETVQEVHIHNQKNCELKFILLMTIIIIIITLFRRTPHLQPAHWLYRTACSSYRQVGCYRPTGGVPP